VFQPSAPLPRLRRTRPKQELRIQIGDAFTDDIPNSFAVTPPMLGIVIWVWNRNDADLHAVAKCLLKEKPCPPRVKVFGHDVHVADLYLVSGKPISQRHSGTISPVSVNNM